MTQEQCDRYNKWVAAYNRVVNCYNDMMRAYSELGSALISLNDSYVIDGETNNTKRIKNICSSIYDRGNHLIRVVLPYIDNQLKKIANE